MASIQEAAAEAREIKPGVGVTPPPDDEFISDEEQAIADINEAIGLLRRTNILLSFLGDQEMCKSISKRERAAIARVTARVREFVDAMSAHYEDVES